jgi:raffinose/stachyose/melibiose transport system permease protein
MRPVRAVHATVNHLVAGGAGIIALAPIYIVVVNSVKTASAAASMSASLPLHPRWGNFAEVNAQAGLLRAFFNSLLYSLGSTALAVLLAGLAAFALARRRSRPHIFIYFLLIMGIAIPTNYVTLTKVMQLTHLLDTQLGIILIYASQMIPFDVFLIYAFVDSVPRELDESAFIDGCSPIRTFFGIMLPLMKPALITCGILNVLNVWSDFINPLYFLSSASNWPMTLSIYNFFGTAASVINSNWALVSADVLMTILPVILIYIAAQRWILSGVLTGAVKG